MNYPYTQSWWDYGVRNGPTLGLCYHMAEGSGTVGYLDNKGNPPPRGVSVHAVCQLDGTVVQMLPWSHASGSLNPDDRTTEYGYYGHDTLIAVLGSYWLDPNVAVLSMEIEGFRAQGPNPKQVAAAIAWGLDMKSHYPELRGAIGHHDQSPKECPGTTAAMKAIFAGVGGHGLWQQETVMLEVEFPDGPLVTGTITIPKGKTAYRIGSGAPVTIGGATNRNAVRVVKVGGSSGYQFDWDVPSAAHFVYTPDATFTPAVTDCTAQITAAVAKEHEENRAAALKAVGDAIP